MLLKAKARVPHERMNWWEVRKCEILMKIDSGCLQSKYVIMMNVGQTAQNACRISLLKTEKDVLRLTLEICLLFAGERHVCTLLANVRI